MELLFCCIGNFLNRYFCWSVFETGSELRSKKFLSNCQKTERSASGSLFMSPVLEKE